jgi:hypothetical protein
MDLPSLSSGKKRETYFMLDPTDRAITDLCPPPPPHTLHFPEDEDKSILRNVVTVLRFLAN